MAPSPVPPPEAPGGGGEAPPAAPQGGPRFPPEALPAKKKRPSPLKVILLVLATLTVLGAGSCATCVCLGMRKGRQLHEQADADRQAAREVRIADLLSAYRAGEAAADKLYKDRWLVVTEGQVESVKRPAGAQGYVILGSGKPGEIPEVQCMLRPDQAEKGAALSKGSPVRVRGQVHGLVLNVVMYACEIL
jgi:hypothetical protein